MDLLKELIDSLDEAGSKDFKSFLNRFRRKSERKDLDLFNFYVKGKSDKREKILEHVYPNDNNLEAYHATRKRLIRQLVEFISTKGRSEDVASERYIENMIFISKYFFDKNREEAAWSFLKQAEQLAKNGDHHRLLNNIYSLQIVKSQTEFAPDLKVLIKEKEKYQKLALEDENANIAYHLIRYEINLSVQAGKQINIEKIIKKILNDYGLKKIVVERPKLMYNIIAITRSSILATKEYYKFEPYIIEKFEQLERKEKFNRFNHHYKVNLLYMIAHVLYRNKKFKEASRYLDVLHKNIFEFNKSQFHHMYPRYTLLLAAVHNYSGRNKLAIDILENILKDKKIKMDKSTQLNTYLNLSTYYFQREEYHKSIRLFQNVQHSDKWLSKIMGREWVLKKNIIECINQFELNNSDIVESRIRSMERNFKDLFKVDMYKRVQTFLHVVKELNKNPNIASSKDFYNLVESSFEFISAEIEDIQAMTFYQWIEAKIQKRKYYDVLIQSVNFRKE